MIDNYLDSVKARFGYYKNLIEKTIDQLSDSDLHWQYDEHSNSIMVNLGARRVKEVWRTSTFSS